MLIVRIGEKRILFFLSFSLISFNFLFHLINDSLDSFIGNWIKFLTDIFDADFVKHFSNKKLWLLILLLLLLLRLFVHGFLLCSWFLLYILEFLWKWFNFLVLKLLRCLRNLLLLVRASFGCLILWQFRLLCKVSFWTLLGFWLSSLEILGFLIGLRSVIRLSLLLFLNGNQRRKLLLLLELHQSQSLEINYLS